MPYPQGMQPQVLDDVLIGGQEKTIQKLGHGYATFPRGENDRHGSQYSRTEDLEFIARPLLPPTERYASGEIPQIGDKVAHAKSPRRVLGRVNDISAGGIIGISYLSCMRHCKKMVHRYRLVQRA